VSLALSAVPQRRALVLDFGSVISRSLFETHDLTERALGLAPGTLRWRGPLDPAGDVLWQALQRDEITERGYWLQRTREVGALLGEHWSEMRQFVRRARGSDAMAVIRPEALQAIARAREAGHALAVLSNELDLFYGADFRGRLPFLRDFDAIVDATYSGILKPDPRAYRAVEQVLGVPGAHCVLVDDQRRNVEGALGAGWQAVQLDVRDPQPAFEAALAWLRSGTPAPRRAAANARLP
jgi:putative hydrolase of the HAD superfamily